MNLTTKHKYRIVQTEEDFFQVEFKRPFHLFWEYLNGHGSIYSARRCRDHMRNKEKQFPRVVQ